jgi:multidrug resistance efflux pump
MLELMLCSILTILPDFLYRRYAQGKQIGKEITLFSVWFELRWGLTLCLMLTIALITIVFYNHPSTQVASSLFRTMPIVPEGNGRVAEVFLGLSDEIRQGDPIFRLDASKQEAEAETARRKITEVEAAIIVARSDIDAAQGQIQNAEGSLQQARDELATKEELYRRNPGNVAFREIERLRVTIQAREGALVSAVATKEAASARVSRLLPAEKASAEAALAQAEVEINKSIVRAGVTGRVEQFTLRVGDVVNPFMRPAGILIPEGSGRKAIIAGFGQVEAQVIRVGMLAEISCVSMPWRIIPMVVTRLQDYIASGQFRGGEQLVDVQQTAKPGTLLVTLEPYYENGLDGITPGSNCAANLYSNHHDEIKSAETGWFRKTSLHVIDAVGLVHAMLLRVQALILPIKTLVFGGH